MRIPTPSEERDEGERPGFKLGGPVGKSVSDGWPGGSDSKPRHKGKGSFK